MGKYINPGNEGFTEVLSKEYVDKTMFIDLINGNIGRTGKLPISHTATITLDSRNFLQVTDK